MSTLEINVERNVVVATGGGRDLHAESTFFLHGNADRVVPVTASLNMYRRLSEVGARAEMHIYAEQPHGWARWPAWVEPTMAEAAVFLDRYVVAPERYAPPEDAGG